MHDQAGARVDLDHRAPLLLEGLSDIFRDQVDAGDVQPDRARCEHALFGRLGVQTIGLVDRQIAVVTKHGRAPRLCHRLRREPLACQQIERDRIEHEGGQWLRCVLAAQRIAIADHDQLFDAVLPVADERLRLSAARGHGLVANDQYAVLTARNAALDDHARSDEFFLCDGEGAQHGLAILELNRDTAALVAALRLHDHR